ncbi:MAG: glycosyltransferase family 1 protein, partial [Candidatus Aminicenantes bacterium]|nr:glycosyltransferase family 1 protein [Candidatus Aminicenantes bacterium]
MNIACDIRVFLSKETGVGTCYKNLLNQLAESDKQNRYLLFSSSWKERFPSAKLPRFAACRLIDARLPVKALNWLWSTWRHPPLEFFFREKIDVSHSPTPMLLPCHGKKIITIHDLFFMTDEERVQPESRRYFRARLGENIARADGIICVSEAARSSLLEIFPAAAEKTRVIHHGVAPHFFVEPDRRRSCREKYRLPEKYILFTGTIEPRKNLATLLKALIELKRSNIIIPLVIAGSRGWGSSEFIALVKELTGQVREVGYVEDADLPGLYREAQFFVFPSLAEGFGLPLLESLASGTPVLCSDIPAFHEIGLELPIYFQSTSVPELGEKMESLWLQDKETDREARIAHARSFSWQKSAARTLSFYH